MSKDKFECHSSCPHGFWHVLWATIKGNSSEVPKSDFFLLLFKETFSTTPEALFVPAANHSVHREQRASPKLPLGNCIQVRVSQIRQCLCWVCLHTPVIPRGLQILGQPVQHSEAQSQKKKVLGLGLVESVLTSLCAFFPTRLWITATARESCTGMWNLTMSW
jgi:hypothetical protein